MLRLKSLGQTLIEAGEARLTPAAETVFATALYLIIEAGRPVGRDELTRLLWPDVSEARAQHGLRQALYRLKTLGATIKADRSSLILSPRFCTTDYAELLALQPPTVQEELAEKVGGSFLPGYSPQLSEEFTSWVERQRDVVHSAVARALVSGMQAKKRVSDWNGAEQLASMCLSIDPLNEEATLTVAEAAALGGSKTKALSILNHYLKDIGDNASEIKLPAVLLRRRISEAYQDNIFPVRDAPFVGREEEMAELTRALARAQSGHGSAYVISGEPGIGKTRLVSEFTRVAALQRVHIVRVGCQSHDVRRPLSAFVDLVPKLLALPGALGCAPESMLYLRKLTALEKEDTSGDHQGKNTEGIFEHVRAAVLDVVDALASECCLVIHIEDSQWMDAYSKSLLTTLFEQASTHRLLLLAALTTEKSVERLNERTGASFIHVKPLNSAASARLLDITLSSRRVSSSTFRDWCVRSSCGNPFFILELGIHAVDDGSFTTPPSLSKLIDARLSSLSMLSCRVLQASCILGRHARLVTIERVLDEKRINLLESLDELTAGGFIDHESESIVSRHALITEAALSRASSASKSLLHRHAAQALQDSAQDNATVIWDCAEHWRQAGDHPRAVELMADCARHSLELGLPLEAAMMLGAAADLASDERRVSLLRDCTMAYSVAADWDAASRYADRTVNAMKKASANIATLAEAELEQLVIMARRSALSQDMLTKLLALVASAEVRISVRLRAAIIAMMAADNMQDKRLADQVYSAISEIEPEADADNAHHDHCLLIYHCSFGDARRAQPAIARLVTFARTIQDYSARATYLEHSGHAHRVNGNVERARSLYVEAFETAQAHYLYHRAEAAADSLVGLSLAYADLTSARKWCDLSKEESRKSKRVAAMDESLSYESELCIREGKFDEARSLIFTLREYSARLNSVRARSRQLALEADLRLSAGYALTDRECRELLSLSPKVARAFRNDYFVAQLVRGLISVKRIPEASQVLTQYLRHDRLSHEPLFRDLVQLRDVRGVDWPLDFHEQPQSIPE